MKAIVIQIKGHFTHFDGRMSLRSIVNMKSGPAVCVLERNDELKQHERALHQLESKLKDISLLFSTGVPGLMAE